MATSTSAPPFTAELPKAFHQGWNLIDGVTADGNTLTIVPERYFFRYESPTWLLCDWSGVVRDLLGSKETPDHSIEQMALDYIKAHGHTTHDPAEVLVTAYQAYSYLFRTEQLNDPSLVRMGVTAEHLNMLTEMGTMMALNRIDESGDIPNVGPAWMFGEACKVVYGIDGAEAELVDELYHGTFFNEPRRVESVIVHAALGGRLVHGCQSGVEINMAGGCVAPYGADIERFRSELGRFRETWIEAVRACGE